MIDKTVKYIKAKSFLISLVSNTNLVFTSSQNLQVKLDKSTVHSYIVLIYKI